MIADEQDAVADQVVPVGDAGDERADDVAGEAGERDHPAEDHQQQAADDAADLADRGLVRAAA